MTNDTYDPLDDLKSALNDATPAPDAATRAAHIALATKNFANMKHDLQGSRPDPRPTFSNTLWTGAKTMLNTLTSRGALTVTTALVACTVMVVTPAGRDLLNLPAPVKTASPAFPTEADTLIRPRGQSPVPALESELSDVASDLEAGAVLALEARQAPDPSVAQARQGEAEPTMAEPIVEMMPVVVMEESASTAPLGGLLSGAANAIDQIAADMPATTVEPSTETFAYAPPNPLKITAEAPVSTFSIDVDTASYSLIRSSLTSGRWPFPLSVRVEEMINYFPYAYPAPTGPHPFEPTVSVFETPWNADTQLVHIGIQGELPAIADRPPLNLVFLIDTSGSMNQPNKLPLLRQSFRLMLDNLRPEDEVAIVTYAGSSTTALPPTQAAERDTILAALNALTAGGSTNGQGGLEQAYALAEQMTDDGDVSRVILATDGDFNVGLSDPRGLETYIEDKRDTGTYLSVLGFGRGNLQDATMQALAQNGNGTAAYIDTLSEAQKVLVDQLTGALFPIANDVKIQVEFNPATVAEYRLIGYETRALNREDFNNDAVDAGELGAGHTVTAIYEITPTGSPAQLSDPLRYQAGETTTASDELGFLRLRYKAPGTRDSQLIETPFAAPETSTGTPGTEALFAAAVAGFGQLLRDDTYLNGWTYGDAIQLANANRADDPFGYRTQAVQLMRLAQSLDN